MKPINKLDELYEAMFTKTFDQLRELGYSNGEIEVTGAYQKAIKEQLELINFDNIYFDDYEGIAQALIESDITAFTVSEQSTALMRILAGFNKTPFKIAGLVELTYTPSWRDNKPEVKPAILFTR